MLNYCYTPENNKNYTSFFLIKNFRKSPSNSFVCQSGALLSIIHTVVESPFDSKEIKPVNPKGYQL